MKNLTRRLAGLGVALAVVQAGGAAPSAGTPSGDEGKSYTFQQAPVNSLGVKGLADLRGKPVLIDFWGTH